MTSEFTPYKCNLCEDKGYRISRWRGEEENGYIYNCSCEAGRRIKEKLPGSEFEVGQIYLIPKEMDYMCGKYIKIIEADVSVKNPTNSWRFVVLDENKIQINTGFFQTGSNIYHWLSDSKRNNPNSVTYESANLVLSDINYDI